MKDINLGRVLIENRHKRGITQDELAAFMGVSKASVSKWETSTTYPDIELLPRLAAFFNISIDELMGYEPQMDREEIRKLYRRLTREFGEKPFDQVLGDCGQIARKYYACSPLLFQIGSLYVNHCMLAETQKRQAEVIEEARRLFVKVREESRDAELVSQAMSMEALCLLRQGRAGEVLTLLAPLEAVRLAPEPLLATAYGMTGDLEQAKRVLQAGIYMRLTELLELLASYTGLCDGDRYRLEETCRRLESVCEIFNLEGLHPGMLLSLYLTLAGGYLKLGRRKDALEILKKYGNLALSGIFPLQLCGDAYFNLLEGWMEDCLMLGGAMPRDGAVVRRGILQALEENPAFDALREEQEYKNIVRRLKKRWEA